MSSPSHLLAAPDPAFWKDILFFERFDTLMEEARTPDGLNAAWKEVGASSSLRQATDAIAERHGGGHVVRQQLVLAAAFCEHKRAAAVETVARTVLGDDDLEERRTAGGQLRRHPTALALFERDPGHLLAIDLWHRWHSQRASHYRVKAPLAAPILLDAVPWGTVIAEALDELRDDPHAQTRRFEAHRVFAGPDDDVLLAFREWPKRRAVRTDAGPVVSGQTPEWTLLRFHRGGTRLDVTDIMVDRGAILANAILRRLITDAPPYELVLEPLKDRKLDEFLALLTDPADDVFPLIEITALETWAPGRIPHTITGTPKRTVEKSVVDLRRLGAFALDWRTVKSAKVRFENDYRILIHFPPAGEPTALSYSDIDRDKAVTARFAALLQKTLRVEVGPKNRRGATRPHLPADVAPTKHGGAWWSRVLDTQHDRPADWLTAALTEVEGLGLVTLSRSRVLACGSPYLNRRAAGVDSLDCDGEVELPWEEADPDDASRDEDDGFCVCSRGDHRWRPNHYKLPVDERVRVDLVHDAVWRHLLSQAGHYAAVEEEPGRPGVFTLRLPTTRIALVYAPLASADDLVPGAFGRIPTVWTYPPCSAPPDVGERAVPLATALADLGDLAAVWGVSLYRARKPYTLHAELPMFVRDPGATGNGPLTRTLEITNDGVALDGTHVAAASHMAGPLLALLRAAAAQDEADDSDRQPWTPESLIKLAAQRGTRLERKHLHTWISRTRAAIDEAFRDPELGKRVIVTHRGSYRLGDGFVCVDRRTAPTGG